MTKRMLSLLLALVMTLSLCVPALAADDFAAEAVTETGEQAPDTPAAAAVTEEEEDVPEAIAYAVNVSAEARQKLADAITAAAADVDAVKAHTKMTLGTNMDATINLIKGQLAKTAKDNVVAAYDNAVKLQDEILGAAANRTDKNVTDAVDALLKAREALKSEATQKFDETGIAGDDVKGILGSSSADNDPASYFKNFGGTSDWFTTVNAANSKTNEANLKMARRADYVDKLIAAVADVDAYNEDAAVSKQPVKALWDAVEALWNLRVGSDAEKAAKVPYDTEAAALWDLYDAAKKKVDDTTHYNGADLNIANGINADNGRAATPSAKVAVDWVGQQFDKAGHSNTLVTGTSYWTYSVALNNIKEAAKVLKEKAQLVKFDTYSVMNNKQITVYLTFDESDSTKTDVNDYIITYQKKDQTYERVLGADLSLADAALNSYKISAQDVKTQVDKADAGEYVVTWKFDNGATALKSTDTVTFRLYTVANGVASASPVGEAMVVNTIDDNYTGPLFRGTATFDTKTGEVTGKLSLDITNANDSKVSNYEIALTAEGKESQKLTKTSASTVGSVGSKQVDSAWHPYYTFTKEAVDKVVTNAGTYTLTLMVQQSTPADSGLLPRGTTTVTVPALEKYKNSSPISAPAKLTVANVKAMGSKVAGINDLQTFVDAVKGLSTDLVLVEKFADTTETGAAYVEDIATAKTLLANAVAAAEKLISDAATLAYTDTNKTKVTTAVNDITKILGYLNEGADTTEFTAALAKAKALVKSDYTTNSWLLSGIEAAIKAADDAVKAHERFGFQDISTDRVILKEWTKALNDAMDKLVAVGADKTALNAAIAAAEALKEEDYTAESWKDAALADAIAAAKLVAAKDNAGKTEIDAAVAALKAATDKLVKKTAEPTEGPKAPASGTGWVKYEGEWYFFKGSKLVENYWVGQADGASKWSTNWYYVGSDGKMATGLQYIDDLKGGKAWYMLQTTETNGEIGKMLTGWQWTYSAAGTAFS